MENTEGGGQGPGGDVAGATRVAAVRLRPGLPPDHFDAGALDLRDGEWVVVETPHGPEVGQTVGRVVSLPLDASLPQVVRIASTEEIKSYGANLEREKKAWRICQELIDNHGLEMKLVRVESFFDGSKIIFYYSADGRVDFRELVKDLVKALHTRIEMRQIGIRHEAKMVGGIGSCGRAICCAGFMKNFAPVSIKMAKVQNLPLNPNKISGLCGRLLCCITYEYQAYADGTMAAWAKEAAEAARIQAEALADEPVFPGLDSGGEEPAEGGGGQSGERQARREGPGQGSGRTEKKGGRRRSGRRRRPQKAKQKGGNGSAAKGQGGKQSNKSRRGKRKRDEQGNGRKQ